MYTGIIKRDTVVFAQLTNGKCFSDMQPIHLIFDKPTAKIQNQDTVVVIGANISLKGSGAKYHRWEPGTYLDNPNIANPLASPDDDVTYHLIVSNDNGCSDTASVAIRVRKKVVIPNTFTPNGDGVNDTWAIKYLDRLPQNQMYIYTRSGKMVRQFKGYYNSWDGTNSKGERLPSGVYYYVLMIDDTNEQSGYVTLIR